MNPTNASHRLHASPSKLPADSRERLVGEYNRLLADTLDLFSQVKTAHWNVRGPLFTTLHPFFDQIASGLALKLDALAERVTVLGGQTRASAKTSAALSRLAPYDESLTRDLDHARELAERLETYLEGVRRARTLGEELGDVETVDLLTQTGDQLEKEAWFLRATLG
jgi:starvation-inducible DNA-binding protein